MNTMKFFFFDLQKQSIQKKVEMNHSSRRRRRRRKINKLKSIRYQSVDGVILVQVSKIIDC